MGELLYLQRLEEKPPADPIAEEFNRIEEANRERRDRQRKQRETDNQDLTRRWGLRKPRTRGSKPPGSGGSGSSPA